MLLWWLFAHHAQSSTAPAARVWWLQSASHKSTFRLPGKARSIGLGRCLDRVNPLVDSSTSDKPIQSPSRSAGGGDQAVVAAPTASPSGGAPTSRALLPSSLPWPHHPSSIRSFSSGHHKQLAKADPSLPTAFYKPLGLKGRPRRAPATAAGVPQHEPELAERESQRRQHNPRGQDQGGARAAAEGVPQRLPSAARPPRLENAELTSYITNTTSPQQLLGLLQRIQAQLNSIHVCAALRALARLSQAAAKGDVPASGPGPPSTSSSQSSSRGKGRRREAPLEDDSSVQSSQEASLGAMKLLSQWLQQQPQQAVRTWEMALAAWACCKLGYREAALLEAIKQVVLLDPGALVPADIVCLATACSKLGWTPPDLLEVLTAQATAKAAEFNPRALTTALHHLTECGAATPALLEEAADLLVPALGQLYPVDLSLLASVCQRSRFHDPVLLEALAKRSLSCLRRFPPWMLAQLASSCCRLGFYHEELCSEMVRAATEQLQRQPRLLLQPQQEPAGASGLPLGDRHGPSPTSKSRSSYSPNDVSTLCYSLARLGHRAPALLDVAVGHGLQGSSSFSPVASAMLTWALRLSGHKREDWEEEVARQGSLQLDKLPDQQVAALLAALCGVKASGPAAKAFITAAMGQLAGSSATMLSTSQLVHCVTAVAGWVPGRGLNSPLQQQQQQRQEVPDEVGGVAGAAEAHRERTSVDAGTDEPAAGAASGSRAGGLEPEPMQLRHRRLEFLRVLGGECASRRQLLDVSQVSSLQVALGKVQGLPELQEQFCGWVRELQGGQQQEQALQLRSAGEAVAASWDAAFAPVASGKRSRGRHSR